MVTMIAETTVMKIIVVVMLLDSITFSIYVLFSPHHRFKLYLEVAAGFLFVGLIILCVFIAVCVCRRKKGGYTAGETSYYWDIMIIVS